MYMKSIDNIGNWEELADELLNVVTELHCREVSGKTMIYCDVGYPELCNRAIQILEILRD